VNPIERAVPAMIARRVVFVEGVQVLDLSLAISLHWAIVTLPILFLFGSPLPFSALTQSFSSTLAGGSSARSERAVLVDRDHDADDLALEVGARVELLDELAGVHAVLTERGTDRAARGRPCRRGPGS
jgi:hypothetical protein